MKCVHTLPDMLFDDIALKAAIFALLSKRQPGATICPSEAARAIIQPGEDWRILMPNVRQVAKDLASLGQIQVTQAGQVVDIRSASGPIRLRLPVVSSSAS